MNAVCRLIDSIWIRPRKFTGAISRVGWIITFLASSVLGPEPMNAQQVPLPDSPDVSLTVPLTTNSPVTSQTVRATPLNVRDLPIESYDNPRTINREFIILNTIQVLAAIADAETTLTCTTSSHCREVNPLLGGHPTRGKMYALAVPVTALSVYLSYHYKRKSPTKGWWRIYPLALSAIHGFGAANNLVVANSQ